MKIVNLKCIRITLFFEFIDYSYVILLVLILLHLFCSHYFINSDNSLMNRFIDGGGEIILGDFSSRVSHGVGSARVGAGRVGWAGLPGWSNRRRWGVGKIADLSRGVGPKK